MIDNVDNLATALVPVLLGAISILLGVVGYFLKRLHSTVETITQKVSDFTVSHEGIRILLQEHKSRIEKTEMRLDENDRNWKSFYMEQAKKDQ